MVIREGLEVARVGLREKGRQPHTEECRERMRRLMREEVKVVNSEARRREFEEREAEKKRRKNKRRRG